MSTFEGTPILSSPLVPLTENVFLGESDKMAVFYFPADMLCANYQALLHAVRQSDAADCIRMLRLLFHALTLVDECMLKRSTARETSVFVEAVPCDPNTPDNRGHGNDVAGYRFFFCSKHVSGEKGLWRRPEYELLKKRLEKHEEKRPQPHPEYEDVTLDNYEEAASQAEILLRESTNEMDEAKAAKEHAVAEYRSADAEFKARKREWDKRYKAYERDTDDADLRAACDNAAINSDLAKDVLEEARVARQTALAKFGETTVKHKEHKAVCVAVKKYAQMCAKWIEKRDAIKKQLFLASIKLAKAVPDTMGCALHHVMVAPKNKAGDSVADVSTTAARGKAGGGDPVRRAVVGSIIDECFMDSSEFSRVVSYFTGRRVECSAAGVGERLKTGGDLAPEAVFSPANAARLMRRQKAPFKPHPDFIDCSGYLRETGDDGEGRMRLTGVGEEVSLSRSIAAEVKRPEQEFVRNPNTGEMEPVRVFDFAPRNHSRTFFMSSGQYHPNVVHHLMLPFTKPSPFLIKHKSVVSQIGRAISKEILDKAPESDVELVAEIERLSLAGNDPETLRGFRQLLQEVRTVVRTRSGFCRGEGCVDNMDDLQVFYRDAIKRCDTEEDRLKLRSEIQGIYTRLVSVTSGVSPPLMCAFMHGAAEIASGGRFFDAPFEFDEGMPSYARHLAEISSALEVIYCVHSAHGVTILCLYAVWSMYGMPKNSLHVLMTGPPDTGKSMVGKLLIKLLIKGTIRDVSYSSNLANMTGGREVDMCATFCDEKSNAELGVDTTGRNSGHGSNNDDKNARRKTILADGTITGERMETDPLTGRRFTDRYEAKMRGPQIAGTNVPADKIGSAQASRYIIVPVPKPRRVSKSTGDAIRGEQTRGIDAAQAKFSAQCMNMQYLICEVFTRIREGILPEIDTKAAGTLLTSTMNEARRLNVKGASSNREFMRLLHMTHTLVVHDACAKLWRSKKSPLYDADAKQFVKHEDRHFELVAPLLVANFNHAMTALTLLASEYEDTCRYEVIEAIRDLYFPAGTGRTALKKWDDRVRALADKSFGDQPGAEDNGMRFMTHSKTEIEDVSSASVSVNYIDERLLHSSKFVCSAISSRNERARDSGSATHSNYLPSNNTRSKPWDSAKWACLDTMSAEISVHLGRKNKSETDENIRAVLRGFLRERVVPPSSRLAKQKGYRVVSVEQQSGAVPIMEFNPHGLGGVAFAETVLSNNHSNIMIKIAREFVAGYLPLGTERVFFLGSTDPYRPELFKCTRVRANPAIKVFRTNPNAASVSSVGRVSRFLSNTAEFTGARSTPGNRGIELDRAVEHFCKHLPKHMHTENTRREREALMDLAIECICATPKERVRVGLVEQKDLDDLEQLFADKYEVSNGVYDASAGRYDSETDTWIFGDSKYYAAHDASVTKTPTPLITGSSFLRVRSPDPTPARPTQAEAEQVTSSGGAGRPMLEEDEQGPTDFVRLNAEIASSSSRASPISSGAGGPSRKRASPVSSISSNSIDVFAHGGPLPKRHKHSTAAQHAMQQSRGTVAAFFRGNSRP